MGTKEYKNKTKEAQVTVPRKQLISTIKNILNINKTNENIKIILFPNFVAMGEVYSSSNKLCKIEEMRLDIINEKEGAILLFKTKERIEPPNKIDKLIVAINYEGSKDNPESFAANGCIFFFIFEDIYLGAIKDNYFDMAANKISRWNSTSTSPNCIQTIFFEEEAKDLYVGSY